MVTPSYPESIPVVKNAASGDRCRATPRVVTVIGVFCGFCLIGACVDGTPTGLEAVAWVSESAGRSGLRDLGDGACEEGANCIVALPDASTFIDDIIDRRMVRGYYAGRQLWALEILFDNGDLLAVQSRLTRLFGEPEMVFLVRRVLESGKRVWITEEPVDRDWKWRHRDYGWLTWEELEIWLTGRVQLEADGTAHAIPATSAARLEVRIVDSGSTLLGGSRRTSADSAGGAGR